MRVPVLALLLIAASTACSRQVVVTTPPTAGATAVALRVSNTTSQSVTVSVEYGGTEYTVGSVAANTTAVLSVAQVPAGSTVRLKAALADGSRSYTRDGVVLSGTFDWRVP
jgi:hypothetical protein